MIKQKSENERIQQSTLNLKRPKYYRIDEMMKNLLQWMNDTK